ncbi:hypothetical protein H6P81_010018 [Aristolochia fimbriata]|uniref:Uncharacterized protein n=1 Tax=Aristolochia fimbriata TaxID=158543 RepID=A0AAV7EMI3_ARIFI|nr:hypothetical protein H6P81_010018 [Aristolochia fimbriata]
MPSWQALEVSNTFQKNEIVESQDTRDLSIVLDKVYGRHHGGYERGLGTGWSRRREKIVVSSSEKVNTLSTQLEQAHEEIMALKERERERDERERQSAEQMQWLKDQVLLLTQRITSQGATSQVRMTQISHTAFPMARYIPFYDLTRHKTPKWGSLSLSLSPAFSLGWSTISLVTHVAVEMSFMFFISRSMREKQLQVWALDKNGEDSNFRTILSMKKAPVTLACRSYDNEESTSNIVPSLIHRINSRLGNLQDAFTRNKRISAPKSTGAVLCGHQQMTEGRAWITKASRTRSSVWKVSDKHPGYNASDSDSDELKVESE